MARPTETDLEFLREACKRRPNESLAKLLDDYEKRGKALREIRDACDGADVDADSPVTMACAAIAEKALGDDTAEREGGL